jgi:hypothetical protein
LLSHTPSARDVEADALNADAEGEKVYEWVVTYDVSSIN